MKKNFKMLAALAVAVAATSCSNDDLMTGLENNGAQNKGAIGVNTFVPTITRGAALNSVDDLIASENGFDLISFYNDGSDNYTQFMGTETDGIEFKHDGSAWDYADRGEIKFWKDVPEDATDMKFFAVSPTISKWESAGSYSITADAQTITYTVPTNVSEQVDIMYAQKDLADGDYESDQDAYTNGVPLNFHHALSQIVFKAKIADKEDTDDNGTAEYVTAHVNSITVKNVYGEGTFDMDAASEILQAIYYEDGDLDDKRDNEAYDYNLWTTSGDATIGYEVSTLQNAASITWTEAEELTVGTVGEDETALMLLPQQLTGLDLEAISGGNSANEEQFQTHLSTETGAYLMVNCRVEYKGNDGTTAIVGDKEAAEGEDGYYANLYIPISTQWNPGYKYVYTLIFSADSGDPVKATVESVDEWNEYHENVPEGSEDNTEDDDEEEGNTNNPLALNYNAADLNIGESVTIAKGAASYGRMIPNASTFTTGEAEGESESTLTLVSANDEIASVSGTTITAVAAGRVTVTVTDSETGEEADVEINVLPDYVSTVLSEGIKTVLINSGTYTMGNTYNDEYISDAPVHSVTISNAFYMGQNEVTIGQFVDFVNQNSSVLKIVDYTCDVYNDETENYDEVQSTAVAYSYKDSDGEEFNVLLCDINVNNIVGSSVGSLTVSDEHKYLPVRCSWDGAAAFAKSVGGYLPHEEEWEYAARANTETAFWWRNEDIFQDADEGNEPFISFGQDDEGNDLTYATEDALKEALYLYENFMSVSKDMSSDDDETTNFVFEDTSLRGANVIGRKANPWGLYELFGNVPEWCGNYDYNYEDGIQDEVNHMFRGDLLKLVIWKDAINVHGSGVAFRNCNGEMNETGFRVAFSGTYSGSNSSVQTVSNN